MAASPCAEVPSVRILCVEGLAENPLVGGDEPPASPNIMSNNNTLISDIDRREKLRTYMREYRRRMKEGKKCVQCAKPVHDDTRMCEYHLEKSRERNRRSYRMNSLSRSQHVAIIADLLEERRKATQEFTQQVDSMINHIAEIDGRMASTINALFEKVQLAQQDAEKQ